MPKKKLHTVKGCVHALADVLTCYGSQFVWA